MRVPALILAWLLGFTPLWASSPVGSDREAIVWLDRMVSAIKQLNYEGTFVYIHGHQMETMKIVHSNHNGEEKERLLSLAGEPREILRNNDKLVCILPDSKSVVVEKSRPKNFLPKGLQHITGELKKYYGFRLLGRERMTGRQAVVIDVHPQDPYRYGYHLWIDEQTGMLLKSDLVDSDGVSLEQVMFTSIEFRPYIDDAYLEPTIDSEGFKWFKQTKQDPVADQDSQWSAARLPAGYRMGMYEKHSLPTSREPVEHMMFTDGLSSVSVYIEDKDQLIEPMSSGFSSIGAVNAYTTEVSGHYVTVVGEVPRAAVQMIGDNIRHQSGNKQ